MSEKIYPNVGDHLYLSQHTGNMWVDEVRNPYTVIKVTPKHVTVQECKLIFNGPRYYDTLPDRIEENPEGRCYDLNWAPKKKRWQIDRYNSGYPQIAHFGEWDYAPYLN